MLWANCKSLNGFCCSPITSNAIFPITHHLSVILASFPGISSWNLLQRGVDWEQYSRPIYCLTCWALFQNKDRLSGNRKSRYKDKTISPPSDLSNGNFIMVRRHFCIGSRTPKTITSHVIPILKTYITHLLSMSHKTIHNKISCRVASTKITRRVLSGFEKYCKPVKAHRKCPNAVTGILFESRCYSNMPSQVFKWINLKNMDRI